MFILFCQPIELLQTSLWYGGESSIKTPHSSLAWIEANHKLVVSSLRQSYVSLADFRKRALVRRGLGSAEHSIWRHLSRSICRIRFFPSSFQYFCPVLYKYSELNECRHRILKIWQSIRKYTLSNLFVLGHHQYFDAIWQAVFPTSDQAHELEWGYT